MFPQTVSVPNGFCENPEGVKYDSLLQNSSPIYQWNLQGFV